MASRPQPCLAELLDGPAGEETAPEQFVGPGSAGGRDQIELMEALGILTGARLEQQVAARTRRKGQRAVALGVDGVRRGVAREQELDGARSASEDRVEDRRPAGAIFCAHVGAMGEERAHALEAATPDGKVQRRLLQSSGPRRDLCSSGRRTSQTYLGLPY